MNFLRSYQQVNYSAKFLCAFIILFILEDFIYLFLDRWKGREKEGEKHRSMRDTSTRCLSHAPNQGPGLQPRQVP